MKILSWFKKDYLKQKRSGTGGVLMLFCTLTVATVLALTTAWTKVTTARSVADSVEHMIALQCLASCYINPSDNGIPHSGSASWSGSPVFKSVQSASDKYAKDIYPVEMFKEIMCNYNIIPTRDQAPDDCYCEYNYRDKDSQNQPSFKFQTGSFNIGTDHDVYLSTLNITPNPVKTTIENSYVAKD